MKSVRHFQRCSPEHLRVHARQVAVVAAPERGRVAEDRAEKGAIVTGVLRFDESALIRLAPEKSGLVSGSTLEG